MKMKHLLRSTLLLILLTATLPGLRAGGIEFWENPSWEEVIEKAKAENKPIMLDAVTDWCYWCKVMDAQTFSLDDVGEFFNENFINVRVDMEKGEGVILAAKYRVFSYPSILFFNAKGVLSHKEPGFKERDDFMAMGKEALDPATHLKYPGNASLENPEFPEFYTQAFVKGSDRPERQAVEDWLSGRDLKNEATWSVLVRFGTANEDMVLDLVYRKEEFADHFGESEVMDVLYRMAATPVQQAMKAGDAAAFEAALTKSETYLGELAHDFQVTMRLQFAKTQGNFKQIVKLVGDLMGEKSLDEINSLLNAYAWDIYESCEDPGCIHAATGWMEKLDNAGLHDGNSADTHAALLFKAGKYDAAERMAEKAIGMFQASGADYSSTAELLDKIKAAQAEEEK